MKISIFPDDYISCRALENDPKEWGYDGVALAKLL
jgi:hypothetical protein